MVRPNEPADFWARVDMSGDGCWEWQGARTRPGWHGVLSYQGKKIVASRLAWTLTFGPIPSMELQVCHHCDNPPCCRPDHLFLGTQKMNSIDASRKGRMVRKVMTHCKRGHAFAGNTYIHPITGRRLCHECIRMRNKTRAPSLRPGTHRAKPDGFGTCRVCDETLLYGSMGRGKVGWRHSRWAAAAA